MGRRRATPLERLLYTASGHASSLMEEKIKEAWWIGYKDGEDVAQNKIYLTEHECYYTPSPDLFKAIYQACLEEFEEVNAEWLQGTEEEETEEEEEEEEPKELEETESAPVYH